MSDGDANTLLSNPSKKTRNEANEITTGKGLAPGNKNVYGDPTAQQGDKTQVQTAQVSPQLRALNYELPHTKRGLDDQIGFRNSNR